MNATLYPDSSRTLKNGHDSTHGAAKNEPDPATVELRFRPRPQSTTIHPECFKRFKIVVALSGRFPNRQDSPRIITVLLRFMPIMCLQSLVSFRQFVLRMLSKNQILTSIKDRNSIANLRKTMIYNTNVDLVNDNVYTKFCLNRSIGFQDIEQKLNSDFNQGP